MLKKLFKILAAIVALLAIALTIFWFARPADVSFDELKAAIPHSEYSKFAEINGVKIHYQEKGAGEPLVLIHGYTSSTYAWKDLFEPLSEKYRVIALDLKGFGFSEKPDGDYSRRAQGEIVNGLLEHLKIEKAWIAGNSMGGETALNVALHHPEKVKGLILIDSAGVKIPGRETLAPWYVQTPGIGQILTALAMTSDALVREGLKKSTFDDAQISDEKIAYFHQFLKTRGGQMAAREARIQYALYPIEDELGKINAPTLIIWGKEDEIIPLEAGKVMNERIKNSKMTVFENCGHLPQEEMPEKVLSEMTNFINDKNIISYPPNENVSNLNPVVPNFDANLKQKNYLEESLPMKMREILEKAERFEISAEVRKEGEFDGEGTTFEPNRILKVSNDADKKAILEALYFDASREDSPAICYEPRHSIKAFYEGKTAEVEICFSCSRFISRHGAEKFNGTLVRENRKLETFLNNLLEENFGKMQN